MTEKDDAEHWAHEQPWPRTSVSKRKKNQPQQRVMTFERITTDPEVFGGKPCIRGLRFPVSRVLGLLAAGETEASILESYPFLEPEDIRAALRYAAFLSEEQVIEFA